ncbi:MAG: 50S ribosomal protein L29 [Chlamydia sp.]
MSKTSEIREKDDADLLVRKHELKREIFKLKSSHAPENKDAIHTKVRACKKEVARIETILKEREIEEFFKELSNIESALG